MPSLMSFGPSATFALNLDRMLFWSLGVGVTQDRLDQTFQLTLQVSYPPTVAGVDPSMFRGVLARLDVPMAQTQAALQRVADVALRAGSLVTDIERTTEAFQLFKNQDKVKEADVVACIEEAKTFLRAYWDLRGWLEESAPAAQKIQLGKYLVRYLP